MKKTTAAAYANLAFVKYWGKLNDELNIPLNGSISMNLSNAKTITSVLFDEKLTQDEIFVQGNPVQKKLWLLLIVLVVTLIKFVF